ncbi:CTP synthase [Candidatus Bipolaricaulota bacterium]
MSAPAHKYVVVTGGVLSGLGKGVISASIGLLLKAQGYRVSLQKIDPYVNVDAGTMNPYEHGEVFVTHDGKETDLDIGRYERFLDERLSAANYLTTGQVYWNVIRKERAGQYLGQTVQVIPHVTDEIKRLIRLPLEEDDAEIGVIEVGGTVGDIESLPFLEALRQLKDELPRKDTVFVHVTLLPRLTTSDEVKTKPTQHSVKELRAIGIQPDAIVARCDRPLAESVKRKIALFCDVRIENVIEDPDLPTIYHAPIAMHSHGLTHCIVDGLGLPELEPDLTDWIARVGRLDKPTSQARIGVVGKYVELRDSYISIREALLHAGAGLDTHVVVDWIPSESLSGVDPAPILGHLDGVLIPGGFGERGIDGKIEAVEYARTHRVPFFGLCLGLQCATIEFARNVVGLDGANSAEFDPKTPHPVIALLEEQMHVAEKGGTMRLGIYETALVEGTRSHTCYGNLRIEERHRHRYEFNPAYRERLESAGLQIAGTSCEGQLVEIVELPDHPWFVGVQFHPEFSSRFLAPHPLFVGFVRSCLEQSGSSPS